VAGHRARSARQPRLRGQLHRYTVTLRVATYQPQISSHDQARIQLLAITCMTSLFFTTTKRMVKRARAAASASPPSKKLHLEASLGMLGVASPDAAAAADADPPLGILLRTLECVPTESPEIGDAVAYWMRMEDMRSESTLLSISSLPLICS
jgi:hypothetical protein